MDLVTISLLVVAGMIVAALVTWGIVRSQLTLWRERCSRLETELADRQDLQDQNERLKIHNAELRKEREADAAKLGWVGSAEEKLREAFSALASSALHHNNAQFLQQSRDQFEHLLKRVKGDWGTQREELKGVVNQLKALPIKDDPAAEPLNQKKAEIAGFACVTAVWACRDDAHG